MRIIGSVYAIPRDNATADELITITGEKVEALIAALEEIAFGSYHYVDPQAELHRRISVANAALAAAIAELNKEQEDASLG
jgi:hypothetical protein